MIHNLPQIPAMAVEMPGSTDISGLNLQFGALQFGSEPVLPEYESAPTTATPANQVQNSLYTCPNRLVYIKTQLFKVVQIFLYTCYMYVTCYIVCTVLILFLE